MGPYDTRLALSVSSSWLLHEKLWHVGVATASDDGVVPDVTCASFAVLHVDAVPAAVCESYG